MEILNVTILGDPIPKARPRFSNGRTYTPKRTKEYEQRIRAQLPKISIPQDLPVHVTITAILKRPKRLQRKSDPQGLIPHTKRPDTDNITKAVLDALNAILHDDSQAYSISAQKFYAEIDGQPRTIITIKDMTHEHQ